MKLKILFLLISLFLILPSGIALAQETTTAAPQPIVVESQTDWYSLAIYIGSLLLVFVVTALKHQSAEKAIEMTAKMLPDDFAEKVLVPVLKQVLGDNALIELVDDEDEGGLGVNYHPN